MEARLYRFAQGAHWTLGYIQLRLGYVFTLERGWHDNKRNISRVPPGLYELVDFHGTQGKTKCLVNDPFVTPQETPECERFAILFDVANFYTDLKGCIAPSLMVDLDESIPKAWRSGPARSRLLHYFETEGIQFLEIDDRVLLP